MIQIRAARRDDLPAVYDVLATAFPHQPVELFVRQTERDSTFRLPHLRIATIGGEIKAVVRIFARTMLVRGVRVKAGGIGSVAAHPNARGLGLPTALLHDAIDVMQRDGMAVSFLFTGIPAFYERLGWRTMHQRGLSAPAEGSAALIDEPAYRLLPMALEQLPELMALYRRDNRAASGAIARTLRTWMDARAWLGEDASLVLVKDDRRIVGYVRGRLRDYGYQVLEGACLRGHQRAMELLLHRLRARTPDDARLLSGYFPEGHPLTDAMRTLPGAEETAVEYPAMVRIISLERLLRRLEPALRTQARRHPGPAGAIGLSGPDGEAITLALGKASARASARLRPAWRLNPQSTLDLLFGQRSASTVLPRRASADVKRRLDAVLPETPFCLWNSDRI